MESRKMVPINLFVRQQWRNRHREQAYGHGERGGQSEMYGVSNMETYIIICKIDSQWKCPVYLRELKQGSTSTKRGGMGREMGGRLKRRGHMYTYG